MREGPSRFLPNPRSVALGSAWQRLATSARHRRAHLWCAVADRNFTCRRRRVLRPV